MLSHTDHEKHTHPKLSSYQGSYRLLPLFSYFFFIIENSEFNENKFIVQEVRFHGSCLVILTE